MTKQMYLIEAGDNHGAIKWDDSSRVSAEHIADAMRVALLLYPAATHVIITYIGEA